MLLDPLGPLVINPAFAPKLTGWGLRFIASMRRSAIETTIAALADLNRLAVDAIVQMAAAAGGQDLIVRTGGLKVCRDARTLKTLESELSAVKREGIAAQAIGADELRSFEPGLARDLAGAIFFPNSAHCIDIDALGAAFARASGTIVRARATSLTMRDRGWMIACADGEASIDVPRVLIAAGHASGRLMRPLGYRVPLAPGRGYHLMLGDPGVELRHPVIFQEPHFAATPMRGGIRLAGTMEFAPANVPPNMRRAEMLFQTAQPYVPELRRARATVWMGVRPMSPDSLPMIGAATRHANLYYAFGHGHLGLTQSAITARCIADLVVGKSPPISLKPFDLARFQ
jgi:glycine/D-amino acid oxidase-like deaminating enzyme